MRSNESVSEYIERVGVYPTELDEESRIKKIIASEEDAILDTVIVGGESFVRSSSMFGDRLHSHIFGEFSDRLFEAWWRDGLFRVKTGKL